MEETKGQQALLRFLQCYIYFHVLTEIFLFFYLEGNVLTKHLPSRLLIDFSYRLSRLPFYHSLLNSKLFTLFLIFLASIGTLSRKQKDLDPKTSIIYPLTVGLAILFSGLYFQAKGSTANGVLYEAVYILSSFLGAILVHISMDNISKIISSKLGKDKWNVEEEAFLQPVKPVLTPSSVNIPMLFYYKGKVRNGWINLDNIFRGTLLIGTPGSGKSFGVVNTFIRQLSAKNFSLCIYDFKFPDLASIAYSHFLKAKSDNFESKHEFHVINLIEVEKSRRINPWKSEFISSLADASETAEALVEALKKGDKSGGSDQFFTQSAVNFLAACIYFFSRYDKGKYSSLPHVLAFLNLSYEMIFNTLFSEPELSSLLSPFKTAYNSRAFEQLEGQVGTLKIFISRMATKETFWVFSGDDFDLKISNPATPSSLVLANDPATQNINSACYSVIINRLTRLVNSKGNNPTALIIDEVPTLFMHKIENLIATARSNKVAVLLGLQELPQFKQQYGKDTASTITSVIGNVLAGSVRSKETLEWLERLFGKIKQQGEGLSIDRTRTSVSINEKLEPLIPAGKIASLKAGELVGLLAHDVEERYTGRFSTSAVHCRLNLDLEAIRVEEKNYPSLPVYYDFQGRKSEILSRNFDRINREVMEIANLFN
ncbi:type IV secretion system DNA-binding domain-containing protein [Desertivirga xinjiangensis]|uniref:type IV secretion system DNA-binding domain-containing protein n=1 Tax=Desertivirga xinjiangensis TaxID=539206 RepID=UPI0021098FC8|nr:type IV secretion system DNA-binding domain-containing protein [Pedobacter xinjiangensis]